jgi:NAD(P)H-flavin reductase
MLGPLGKPIEVRSYPGPVLAVAGGVGAAPILPQLRSYRHAGNRIVAILGARNRHQLLLADELRDTTDDLHVTTDDGSFARKGFVTEVMLELLEGGLDPSLVIAIGPPIMMKVCCEIALRHGLPVMASLNPIMVDGTGMCGGCRVTVGDQTLFACVDGPDFDGGRVNWDELLSRLNTYRPQEKAMFDHSCKIGRGRLAS